MGVVLFGRRFVWELQYRVFVISRSCGVWESWCVRVAVCESWGVREMRSVGAAEYGSCRVWELPFRGVSV